MHQAPINTSSNVKSWDWKPENGGTLEIRYHNGSEYHYTGCPATHGHALHRAESPGSYLHENVKGKYQYRRVDKLTSRRSRR